MAKTSRYMGALALALMTLGLWATGPRTCLPCTPSYCSGGYFLPGKGQVPANVVGIWWIPRYQSSSWPRADVTDVGIFQVVDGHVRPAAFSLESLSTSWYLLRLDEYLAAGSTYVLAGRDLCEGENPTQGKFLATSAAPFPETLGILEAHEPVVADLTVATASGACYTTITAAFVELELQLDEGARPWADVYRYHTLVDGVRWGRTSIPEGVDPLRETEGSWVERGKDRVYVLCASTDPGAYSGVEEGEHTAVMQAELPGRDEVLESSTVSFELYCSPPESQDLVEVADEDAADVSGDDPLADVSGDEPLADGPGPDQDFHDETGGCGCTLAPV